jgi:hypothetical protein
MGLIAMWQARRQRERAARRLAAARRAGRGLYLHEWDLAVGAEGAIRSAAAAETIAAWCRETLGRCRRPWGLDAFDLTVACATHGVGGARRMRLRRLRPANLYTPDGVVRQLAAFLAEHGVSSTGTDPGPIRVAVALWSWGDAAHAALP